MNPGYKVENYPVIEEFGVKHIVVNNYHALNEITMAPVYSEDVPKDRVSLCTVAVFHIKPKPQPCPNIQ